MKTAVVTFLSVMGLVLPTLGLDSADLDNRLRLLADRFDEMQHKATAIPAETLRRAQGIMLLDRTKAGFLFAYQGGGGVAMVRDTATGQWSPPAFVSANEASLGFQIGGEQHFIVALFMTTNATHTLLDQKVDLQGEARGTAGHDSSGVQTGPAPSPAILVYDDRQGLYGGASIKGGSVAPDSQANLVYYNQPFTMGDILFNHRAQAGEAAINLAREIDKYSHPQQQQVIGRVSQY